MTSEVVYQGALRTKATHLASSSSIITDAPTDNHGKGEAFSPTDLVATALASCIITTVGIVVEQGRLPQIQMKASIQKNMVNDPRRIGSIDLVLEVSSQNLLSPDDITRIERIAHTCPVARSLHPDLQQNVSFNYQTTGEGIGV